MPSTVFFAILCIVCCAIVQAVKSKHVVEQFKKKKKGKKKVDKEIDYDEIIEKVEEAQEEENEAPDDDNDPDPEDDEGFNSPPGEGGPDDETADDGDDGIGTYGDDGMNSYGPQTAFSIARDPIPNIEAIKEQNQIIAKQDDFFITDLLHFALVEKMSSKRIICVIPDRHKELYIASINENTGSKGLLIGATNPSVILRETYPEGLETIEVHNTNVPYEQAVVNMKYIIFYDDPSNHSFWRWLNSSPMDITFINYMGVQNDAKVALLSKYPYFHIQTTNVKKLVPGRALRQVFFPTLKVNYVVYSNKEFKNEFYRVYDKHRKNNEYQMFYELFFDYYEEILRNRLKIEPSVKLKALGLGKEHFSDNLKQRVFINVNKSLETLEVTSTIRNTFKEMRVGYNELVSVINLRIKFLDRVKFQDQKHRTLDGQFYVVYVSKRRNLVLLQSCILLKHVHKLHMLDDVKATAGGIDKYAHGRLKPYDRVFIKSIDKPATFLHFDTKRRVYLFQVFDDESATAKLYSCFTNEHLLSKKSCESKFDGMGLMKKSSNADIWDRPCLYDEECPFFGKGAFNKFRGGCSSGGFCEMPIGFTNTSYRTYTNVNIGNTGKIRESTVRFQGDLFQK